MIKDGKTVGFPLFELWKPHRMPRQKADGRQQRHPSAVDREVKQSRPPSED